MKRQSARYTRQTGLDGFGVPGQAKLADARILVVGLGGLGIPVVQYLNAMGVGTLGLVENDIVELHNLQRQVLYTEKDVGRPKLDVVMERLSQQNSETELVPYDTFLTTDNALEIISSFDVIVDATDNFPTRYLINDASVLCDKPFVYGALHGFEGQVSVFNYQNGPTYRCVFPDPPKPTEIPNCDENGVLGILPGIIGSLQALEVVKIVSGIGDVLNGELLLYDGLYQQTRKIALKEARGRKKVVALAKDYGHPSCDVLGIISSKAFLKLRGPRQVIDVRTPKEFEAHHLNGAINVPLDEMEQSAHQLRPEVPIYLICQSGKRSALAVTILQKQLPGYKIYSVAGGMNEIDMPCHLK